MSTGIMNLIDAIDMAWNKFLMTVGDQAKLPAGFSFVVIFQNVSCIVKCCDNGIEFTFVADPPLKINRTLQNVYREAPPVAFNLFRSTVSLNKKRDLRNDDCAVVAFNNAAVFLHKECDSMHAETYKAKPLFIDKYLPYFTRDGEDSYFKEADKRASFSCTIQQTQAGENIYAVDYAVTAYKHRVQIWFEDPSVEDSEEEYIVNIIRSANG